MTDPLLTRFTDRSRKVLDLSLLEALSLGHSQVGTEHILLGLIRENEGLAARVLEALDVTASEVREEVIRRLSPERAYAPGAKQIAAAMRRTVRRAVLREQINALIDQLESTTP